MTILTLRKQAGKLITLMDDYYDGDEDGYGPIDSVLHKIKFHNSRKGSIKRYIGVEIEVLGISGIENVNKLHKWAKKWNASITDDGSIASDYGFEIRTSPAKGSKLIQQIKEVCNILRMGKARVDESCGLHVHVDARDFENLDSPHFKKLSFVWAKIEPAMFRLVSSKRRNSEYCEPWFVYPQRPKKVNDLNYSSNSRYKSLNLKAFEYHKTVENRMHQGTINPKKILTWAAINSKIVDFAKKNSIKKIETIKKLNLTTIRKA